MTARQVATARELREKVAELRKQIITFRALNYHASADVLEDRAQRFESRLWQIEAQLAEQGLSA